MISICYICHSVEIKKEEEKNHNCCTSYIQRCNIKFSLTEQIPIFSQLTLKTKNALKVNVMETE